MDKYLINMRLTGGRTILAQFDQLQPKILRGDGYTKIKTIRLRDCAVAAYIFLDAAGFPKLEILDSHTGMPVDLENALSEFRGLSQFNLEVLARNLRQTNTWPFGNRVKGMAQFKIGNSRRAVAAVGSRPLTKGELAMVHHIDGKSVGGAPNFK